MNDPVEERLREDFQRWARDIEPGPELLREVRKIRPARRWTSDWVRVSSVAVVAAATVGAVAMVVHDRPSGGEVTVLGGQGTVTAQAPASGLIGTELRVTGRVGPPSDAVRLTVALRTPQGWATAGTGKTARDGSYSVPVRLTTGGTTTLRVCVTGTTTCSSPVRVVAAPGPAPRRTPTGPTPTGPAPAMSPEPGGTPDPVPTSISTPSRSTAP